MFSILKIIILIILFPLSVFADDISFEFSAKPILPSNPSVVVDEMIEISPFFAPGRGLVKPPVFRLIMGRGSLALFDALSLEEVAGLKRQDAAKFIQNQISQGKTEKDNAFIAGLTNIYNSNQIFVFYNLERMASSNGYAYRILSHEPLHLARLLVTTIEFPNIDYVLDPWVDLNDSNEEYFAEMLERIAAISSHRYFNLQKKSESK